MKILVCDDDREIARAIEIYLNNEGFEVVKAHDGFEALNVVKSEDVKLAIMDVMMPKLDGIQATQMIRNEKDIPIITRLSGSILGQMITLPSLLTQWSLLRELNRSFAGILSSGMQRSQLKKVSIEWADSPWMIIAKKLLSTDEVSH